MSRKFIQEENYFSFVLVVKSLQNRAWLKRVRIQLYTWKGTALNMQISHLIEEIFPVDNHEMKKNSKDNIYLEQIRAKKGGGKKNSLQDGYKCTFQTL